MVLPRRVCIPSYYTASPRRRFPCTGFGDKVGGRYHAFHGKILALDTVVPFILASFEYTTPGPNDKWAIALIVPGKRLHPLLELVKIPSMPEFGIELIAPSHCGRATSQKWLKHGHTHSSECIGTELPDHSCAPGLRSITRTKLVWGAI